MIDSATCPPAHVQEALQAIRARWQAKPRTAIILGSGLGDITRGIEGTVAFGYDQLPRFARSTALGHKGRLVCGYLDGQPVVVMDGRFHLYEGYRLSEICLPIAVLRGLGAELLIITNASGGLNPQYRSGQIMAIADHINLLSPGPRHAAWLGAATTRCGGKAGFYDPGLIERTRAIARREGFVCHQGVYIGVLGPNYETRAEYRFMRRIGGDAVGMSTVPETIAARHLGMQVLALSMITNIANPDQPSKTTPEEVCRLAALAEPQLRKIIRGMLTKPT